MAGMFTHKRLSMPYYDALLTAWSGLPLQHGVEFDAGVSEYSPAAESARERLIDTFGWTIYDGGVDHIAPDAPTLVYAVPEQVVPESATEALLNITVQGEVGSTVYLNGIEVGTIGSDGTLAVTLDLVLGENPFAIILEDHAYDTPDLSQVNSMASAFEAGDF
jgi:hypothetical protein